MYYDDDDNGDDDDEDDDDDEKDAVWLQLHATLDTQTASTLLQINMFRLVLVILMRIS